MRLMFDGLSILCDEPRAHLIPCGNRVRAAGTTTPDRLSQEARQLGWRAFEDPCRRDLCLPHYTRARGRLQLVGAW